MEKNMYIKLNHSGTQHCTSTILIKKINFKKETDVEIRFVEDSFKGRIVSRVSHALMAPLSQTGLHGKEQKGKNQAVWVTGSCAHQLHGVHTPSLPFLTVLSVPFGSMSVITLVTEYLSLQK